MIICIVSFDVVMPMQEICDKQILITVLLMILLQLITLSPAALAFLVFMRFHVLMLDLYILENAFKTLKTYENTPENVRW